MDDIEKELRQKVYNEIMDYEKDFYERKMTGISPFEQKAVNYICNGLKTAASIARGKSASNQS